MFVRVKKVGPYQYLQIAQNRREGKRRQAIRHRIPSAGSSKLTASGAIDQLLRSAARFAERVMVLSEHSRDAHDRPDANVVSIGPALIFERLWREAGCQEVVRKLLRHPPPSFRCRARGVHDRAAPSHGLGLRPQRASVKAGTRPIDGAEALDLQHLYRAMELRSARRSGNASPIRPRRETRQGPHRGGAVRSTPRPVHLARPGVLRHHLVVLHRQRWRHPRPVRQEQGPPQRLQADGAGDGD